MTYYQTHSRADTWLIGIVLGFIIYQINDRPFKMSKVVNYKFYLYFLLDINFYRKS